MRQLQTVKASNHNLGLKKLVSNYGVNDGLASRVWVSNHD